MTFLEVIKNDIENEGLGVFGTDLFLNSKPTKPDNVICIIDTGGYKPGDVRRPTIQFLIRNEGYPSGLKKAEQIFQRYHNKNWYMLDEYEIINSEAINEPTFIGNDDKDRAMISLNILFIRGDY